MIFQRSNLRELSVKRIQYFLVLFTFSAGYLEYFELAIFPLSAGCLGLKTSSNIHLTSTFFRDLLPELWPYSEICMGVKFDILENKI